MRGLIAKSEQSRRVEAGTAANPTNTNSKISDQHMSTYDKFIGLDVHSFPVGVRISALETGAGTTVSVTADKPANFSSLTGPWPQGTCIPDCVALDSTDRTLFAAASAVEPTAFRLTPRGGPEIFCPRLTSRNYINDQGNRAAATGLEIRNRFSRRSG
jgi:hypothetical protein